MSTEEQERSEETPPVPDTMCGARHPQRYICTNDAGHRGDHWATFGDGTEPILWSSVRSWSLPEEPGPEVTRVVDQYGQYFERQFNGQHNLEDEWIGQEFAGDDGIPDLVLLWPLLMAYHAPLTDATPADATQERTP